MIFLFYAKTDESQDFEGLIGFGFLVVVDATDAKGRVNEGDGVYGDDFTVLGGHEEFAGGVVEAKVGDDGSGFFVGAIAQIIAF